MVERRPLQRQIVDVKVKEASPFPEDPNERFEAVFAALGNSEAKCLTLLCLSESPIKTVDLHHRFLEESKGIWKTSSMAQARYCEETFIPSGLVEQADIVDDFGKVEHRFILTEMGRRFGQPIAAFLLEQSSKLPVSFFKIFRTTSKGPGQTSSVINRVKILEYLGKADVPQRRNDVSEALHLDGSLTGNHLGDLAKLGLIEYSAVNPEETGQFKYTLLPDANRERMKNHPRYPLLAQRVINLLFSLKTVDTNQLTKMLKNSHPQLPINSLSSEISTILSFLVKEKIARRGIYESTHIHSQARITPAGKRIVDEIILPIREALALNERLLATWRRIPWRIYAKDAVLKYKEASGHANQKPVEEWMQAIVHIIHKQPGIRPAEIDSLLGRSVSDILPILLRSAKIRRERQGRAVRYYSL